MNYFMADYEKNHSSRVVLCTVSSSTQKMRTVNWHGNAISSIQHV